MTIGWNLYENFDVKERNSFNNMTFSLYIKDEAKTTGFWAIFGLAGYFIFMRIIEWGGP
jgi:CAAX prenyl protease N-terminal, five membrane helices